MADVIRLTDEVRIVDKTRFASHTGDIYSRVLRAENNAIVKETILASTPVTANFGALTNLDELHDIDDVSIKYVKSTDVDGDTFFRYAMPPGTLIAYTRAATVVEDRALLASASATATNNNNVLAALLEDLAAANIITST